MKTHRALAYRYLKVGHVAIESDLPVSITVADKSKVNNMVKGCMDLCPIDRLVSPQEFVEIANCHLTIGDKTYKPIKTKVHKAETKVLDLITK